MVIGHNMSMRLWGKDQSLFSSRRKKKFKNPYHVQIQTRAQTCSTRTCPNVKVPSALASALGNTDSASYSRALPPACSPRLPSPTSNPSRILTTRQRRLLSERGLAAMPGKQHAAATAATRKKTKQTSAATPTVPPARDNSKAAQKSHSTSTTLDKRKRVAPSTDGSARSKKLKTKDVRAAPAAVVPATPDMRVDVSGTPTEATIHTAGQDGNGKDTDVLPNTTGRQRATPSKQQNQKNQKNQPKPKTAKTEKETGTLPLEPHAAVLAELRPRRDVLVLSVISSSKMEKRIAAILGHLGRSPLADPSEPAAAQGASAAAAPPPPGAVLLHARSADSGKLISIAEIAKRRMREGFYREGPQSDGRTAALAWYQYNRLYDVQTEVKKGHENNENRGENEDNEEQDEDGFEPMPQRFQEAVGDAAAGQTVTRTYMSIILSRVALPELLRHSDITCQASVDPVETEYQSWMIPGA